MKQSADRVSGYNLGIQSVFVICSRRMKRKNACSKVKIDIYCNKSS